MNNIQFSEDLWKRLAPREIEIVKAAADGAGIKQTAALMGISRATVQNYRGRIIRKLSCRNMTHAVTILRRGGLIA